MDELSRIFSQYGPYGPLVATIDVGTTNIKFIVFRTGTSDIVASHKVEIGFSSPHEGWLEQDPMEMFEKVMLCMRNTINQLLDLGCRMSDVLAVGMANQRETTIVWDKITGKPLHPAILWSDTRTSNVVNKLLHERLIYPDKDHFKRLTGLPLFNYFSAVKLKWLIMNRLNVREAIEDGRCLFGTVDTWIMWNLLGKKHMTDVTNASRTMLMSLETLDWDDSMLDFFEIPRRILPQIRSSSEVYGTITVGPLQSIFLSASIGDQQASMIGQLCMQQGDAKATYGTGCFVMFNTGMTPYFSDRGLLTTVAYQIGSKEVVYALEGSAAVCGSAFKWLRDGLGIIDNISAISSMAADTSTAGDVVFVPAFSGLYSPHWDPEARGTICDMSEETHAGHIVKSAMEAICFQVREIIEAIEECSVTIGVLNVDGQVVDNDSLMQMQANIGRFAVTKAGTLECTALGAGLAAMWALGMSDDPHEYIFMEGQTFEPLQSAEDVDKKYAAWKRAVEKSRRWCPESTD